MPTQGESLTWISLLGTFVPTDNGVSFKGYEIQPEAETTQTDTPPTTQVTPESTPPTTEKKAGIGMAICSKRFREGSVSVEVEFDQVDDRSIAEIVLQFDASTGTEFLVGLGSEKNSFFALRQWTDSSSVANQQGQLSKTKRWEYIRSGGDRSNFRSKHRYKLTVRVTGLVVSLEIDGIEVIRGFLPPEYRGGQLGVLCSSHADVHYRNLAVESIKPTAFVVMQFNTPAFDDLYKDVISKVCESSGYEPYRADETFRPGFVVADIQKRIAESRLIIAEITPANPNVYYEVGYADALKKPIILLADKGLKELPFDIRPYRTIFYENSIGGTAKVYESLRKYLSEMNGNSG